jgi:hypothetical protein
MGVLKVPVSSIEGFKSLLKAKMPNITVIKLFAKLQLVRKGIPCRAWVAV